MDIDTADHVLHGPSGETWVVAYVEGDRLAWCGWPEGDITALLPIWQQGSWTLPDYGRWVARAVERAHGIKTSHNLCLSCGHSIDAHDRQYGCAEDGCDCETPNT